MNTLQRYMKQNDLNANAISSLCSIDPERVQMWLTRDNVGLVISMSTKEFATISTMFTMIGASGSFGNDLIAETQKQLQDDGVTV